MLHCTRSSRSISALTVLHCSRSEAKNDPFFLPPGAEAFKRDNPGAELHFFETGHFALETHAREIGNAIRDFLQRKLD